MIESPLRRALFLEHGPSALVAFKTLEAFHDGDCELQHRPQG